MKIFILEDDDNRIALFKKRLIRDGRTVIIAKSVREAIEIAPTHAPYDTIFLDHDLAPEHYEDFDPSVQIGEVSERTPDGYDFAKWLVLNVNMVHEGTQIVVHSLNPNGSENMIREINCSNLGPFAIRVPFTRLKEIL